MNKINAKIVAGIVAVILAAGVTTAAAVGSQGFTKKDPQTWFNSWGQTASQEQPNGGDDKTPDTSTTPDTDFHIFKLVSPFGVATYDDFFNTVKWYLSPLSDTDDVNDYACTSISDWEQNKIGFTINEPTFTGDVNITVTISETNKTLGEQLDDKTEKTTTFNYVNEITQAQFFNDFFPEVYQDGQIIQEEYNTVITKRLRDWSEWNDDTEIERRHSIDIKVTVKYGETFIEKYTMKIPTKKPGALSPINPNNPLGPSYF